MAVPSHVGNQSLRPLRFRPTAIAVLIALLSAVSARNALSTVTIADASGHGHSATFQGTPSFIATCVSSALSVDGSVNYGTVGASADQTVQTLTVEGYVRWSGQPGGGGSLNSYIIDKMTQGTDAGRSWYFSIVRSTSRLTAIVFYDNANGHIVVTDPDPLPSNVCTHVAFTVDAEHVRLYVDGVLKDQADWSGHQINYAQNTSIGFANSQNLSAAWVGRLDEFRISNVARTTFPSGANPQPLQVDANTVALWRFDSPPVLGACCHFDGSCEETFSWGCGGTWNGAGSECYPNPCPPPPAGPNAGGVLIAHDENLLLSATNGSVSICSQGSAPPSCIDADTRIDGADSFDNARLWKIYAAFPEGSQPRLRGLSWGIQYDPSALTFITQGNCAGLELPDESWPAPGSGCAVVWQEVQTALLIPVYYFAGYNSSPTLFDLIAHPNMGGYFADDSSPSVLDPVVAYGKLGFDTQGLLVCSYSGPSTGACCSPAGGCTIEAPEDCSGQWLGIGTACTPDACPPPVGACCQHDGACVLTLAANCTAPDVWQGDGTDCTPNPCPQPQGACCQPDGSCAVTSLPGCPAPGTWRGEGTECLPGLCTEGPNARGYLVAHDADLLLSTTNGDISLCAQGTAPTGCGDVDARIDGADSFDNARVWQVYAAFEPESQPRLRGISWGIRYDPAALAIIAHGNCADSEIDDSSWPSSGTGSFLSWSSTRTELVIPAYYFAGYTYGPVASTFDLIAHPGIGGYFIDDSYPPIQDVVLGYGKLGFDTDGLVVCSHTGPLTGACCQTGGSCTVVLSEECPGQWLGVGTVCDPDPCPPPLGACCQSDGDCILIVQTGCTPPSIWQGVDTPCDPNPCPQPLGACCHADASCTLVTQGECVAPDLWRGAGSVCSPDLCGTGGPNADGVIVCHDAGLLLSATNGLSSVCGQGNIPAGCASIDVRIDGTDSYANARVWKVYAAFPEGGSPRLMGITWGVQYNPDHLALVSSGMCGDFELNDANWPDPGTGSSITWSSVNTGLLTPIYYFAGYTYDSVPSTFDLTPNPSPTLGGYFGDDAIPATLDPIAGYGRIGFDTDGLLTCPQPIPALGGCCRPDESCVFVAQAACSGFWLGEGVSCLPNPCPLAPEVRITSGPAEGEYQATPSAAFTWTATDLITPRERLVFSYLLNGQVGGPWGPDTTAAFPPLAEGHYAFEARAKDEQEHVGSALRNFTVDMTAPATALTTGPAEGSWVTSTSVTLVWSATDNLAPADSLRFSYKLDEAEWTAYENVRTIDWDDLSETTHVFQVRARDLAGNVDSTPVVRTFTVDASPPETWITSGPAEGEVLLTNTTTIRWNGSDNLTPRSSLVFSRKLDGGGFGPYLADSSFVWNAMADGPHTFIVRARDLAGLLDPTPDTLNFVVDAQGPAVTITMGPAEGSHIAVVDTTFRWTAADVVTPRLLLEFSYTLDASTSSWGPDTIAVLPGLAEGAHSFEARARDERGHIGSVLRHFTVDPVPPETQILSPAADSTWVTAPDLSLTWRGLDNIDVPGQLRFSFRLDEGTWSAWGSGTSTALHGLEPGWHLFEVKARDLAGNEDPTPAFRHFRVGWVDLLATSIVLPDSAFFDRPFEISWTVRNDGSAPVTATWYDRISLSTDPQVGGDTQISDFLRQRGLDPADSYSVTRQLTVPWRPEGDFWLVAAADARGQIVETGGEANNSEASPHALHLRTPPHPDLLVSAIDAPTEGWAGANLQLSWTVSNLGGDAAAGGWRDQVFLSPDSLLGDDIPVATFNYAGDLPAGENYEHVHIVSLPGSLAGNYRVVVQTDVLDRIEEYDQEGNNTALGPPVLIHEEPYPDLVVDLVEAPAETGAGEAQLVRWRVSNVGTQSTDVPLWYDRVLLSPQPFIVPGATTSLGDFANQSYLQPGGSYENTATITIPEGIAGVYYLLVQADATSRLNELGHEENNITPCDHATTVHLFLPFLRVNVVQVPLNAWSGEPIDVHWQVENVGEAIFTSSQWDDGMYLSEDAVWDPQEDIALGSGYFHYAPLAPGETADMDGTVRLPANASGLQHLIVVPNVHQIDMVHGLYASDSLTITVSPPPDLELMAVACADSVPTGMPLQVEWTVRNQGPGVTGVPQWHDALYLSADDQYDPGVDLLLGTYTIQTYLAAGEEYVQSVYVNIPGDRWGTWRILARTDSQGEVAEGEYEGNNLGASGVLEVYLLPADLQTTSVEPQAEAWSGQSMPLRWTVRNAGTGGTAASAWNDRIYLSDDDVLDTQEDQFLRAVGHNGLLPSEGEYAGSTTVTFPNGISGTRYLIVRADADNNVFEYGGEDNNDRAAAIQIQLTPPPDLRIAEVRPDTAAWSGRSLRVDWTGRNQGPGAIGASSWTDGVYLSADSVFQSGVDPLVASQAHQGPLGEGAEYQGTASFNLPNGISGREYVFVLADFSDTIYEHDNEGNNLGSAPIEIRLTPPPDLQCVSADIPQAWSGQVLSFSWTVANLGTGETGSTIWSDAVYLSTDSLLTPGTDLLISSPGHTGALDPGGQYVGSGTYLIPNGTEGLRYLFFVCDRNNQVYEYQSEGNNVLRRSVSVQLTPPPDLRVTDLQSPGEGMAGRSTSLSWTVTNTGVGETGAESWQDRIYLSQDQVIQTGQDVLLVTATHQGRLGPGAGYMQTRMVNLPANMTGGLYLIAQTDAADAVYEHSWEGNNTLARPIVVQPPPATLPDLSVLDFTPPVLKFEETRTTGEVQWTVRNTGAYAPPESQSYWSDALYLSADSVLDAEDTQLGTYSHTGGLAPGADYVRSATVHFPDGASGNWVLILAVDSEDRVAETDSGNNLALREVNISLQPADLVPSNIVIPETSISGQVLPVRWTVSNAGSGATEAAAWFDIVYLSRDAILDETDFLLGSHRHSGALGPAESYSDSLAASVSLGLSGPYFVLVKTDSDNEVYEHQAEGNNLGRSPDRVEITIPPPADLVVDAVTVPVNGTAGEPVEIGWQVSNIGENPAPDRWTDAIYLSADSQWSLSDPLLGMVEHTGGLDAGKSYRGFYQGTIETDLPGLVPGSYHVLVRTDVRNNVNEENEDNNEGASDSTLAAGLTRLAPEVARDVPTSTAQTQYFQVQTGPEEDIQLLIDASDIHCALHAYVGYGYIPDRIHFSSSHAISPSLSVILPGGEGCYLTVYADYTPGPVTYQVFFRELPFGISEVVPWQVGNAGFSTLTLYGGQLSTVTDVRLLRPGAPQIDSWRVDPLSSARCEAAFDLRDAPSGWYTVQAVTAAGDTIRRANAVEVTPGGGPFVALTVDGSSSMRERSENDYIVTLRNGGNSDDYDVFTQVALAAGASYQIVSADSTGPRRVSDGAPMLITIREIRAGASAQYTLRVWAADDVSLDISAVENDLTLLGPAEPPGLPTSGVVFTYLGDLAGIYSDTLASRGWTVDRETFTRVSEDLYRTSHPAVPAGLLQDRLEEALAGAAALLIQGPVPDSVEAAAEGAVHAAMLDLVALALEGGTQQRTQIYIRVVRASDPNEIVGPNGYENGFVARTALLPYRIYFENVSSATAPAQEVRITNQLSPNLDTRLFRLGAIHFAGMVVDVPEDRSYYHTSLPLESGMLLEIDAGIDVIGGTAHWYFNTIDPETGLPPADAMEGFLPPNDSTGVGQGHVAYTIKPQGDRPPGTEIPNSAVIYFDQNEPIQTNTVISTIRDSWPDLQPIWVDILPTAIPPAEGDTIRIAATIRNNGEVPADSVEVGFYDGDPQSGGMLIGQPIPLAEMEAMGEAQATAVWIPRGITGERRVWIVADPQERILEEEEGNNAWQTGLQIYPRSFTIRVAEGLNVVSSPLDPGPGYRASDFAGELGAGMLIGVDSTGAFVPWVREDPLSEDFPVLGGQGYVAFLDASGEATLHGITRDGAVRVRPGVNLVSIPLEPEVPIRARGLAQMLGASAMAEYDTDLRGFEPFVPEFHAGDGFVATGGKGYLAITERDTTVILAGHGFSGSQPYWRAPGGRPVPPPDSVTAVLALTGTLRQQVRAELRDLEDECGVEIRNLRTGASRTATARAGTGHFACVFLEYSGAAAAAGDTLEARFQRSDGTPLDGALRAILSRSDIGRGYARLDAAVVLPPGRTLMEAGRPNPFHRESAIRYQLASPAKVSLNIYSVDGRLVRRVVDGLQPAGYYEAFWNGDSDSGSPTAAGVYFCRFSAGGVRSDQKLVRIH